MKRNEQLAAVDTAPSSAGSPGDLLGEWVAHLRDRRASLREEWVRRVRVANMLRAMSDAETLSEANALCDKYLELLETGSPEALQSYAQALSERIIPRDIKTDELLGIVLVLRDVLARSLLNEYRDDLQRFSQALDAFEPATNRIAATVAASFVAQRERVICQHQKAIRELSTPVLQLRDRLLILPIIGAIDGQRARQLTEQLLRGVRTNRAKVVVVDVTGVPDVDSAVANHLLQAVEASRLMGASVIISGLSAETAQTLVTLGINLSTVNAVVDLQGGIEEAEHLLGHEVVKVGQPAVGDGELHASSSMVIRPAGPGRGAAGSQVADGRIPSPVRSWDWHDNHDDEMVESK